MNTKKRLIKVIKKTANELNELVDITDNVNLVEMYNFESIKIIQLIINIEEEFGIEIGDDELDIQNIVIVGNIVRMIEKKLNERIYLCDETALPEIWKSDVRKVEIIDGSSIRVMLCLNHILRA